MCDPGDTVKSAERFETQAIDCHSFSVYRNSAAKILHGTKAYSHTDNVMAISQQENFPIFFKLSLAMCSYNYFFVFLTSQLWHNYLNFILILLLL